jgi:hypothetical protein
MNVNTAGLELAPLLTRDGKSLYFNASSEGVLKLAQRDDPSGTFGTPSDLAGLQDYPDAPYLARDDDVLYYDAYDDTLSDRHIWRAELTGVGFSTSEIQIQDSATLHPSHAVISRDERTLYFSGTVPSVSIDVYVAKRNDRSEPFSNPVKVDELSMSNDASRPTWLSEDGCRMVLEIGTSLYLSIRPK